MRIASGEDEDAFGEGEGGTAEAESRRLAAIFLGLDGVTLVTS